MEFVSTIMEHNDDRKVSVAGTLSRRKFHVRFAVFSLAGWVSFCEACDIA